MYKQLTGSIILFSLYKFYFSIVFLMSLKKALNFTKLRRLKILDFFYNMNVGFIFNFI